MLQGSKTIKKKEKRRRERKRGRKERKKRKREGKKEKRREKRRKDGRKGITGMIEAISKIHNSNVKLTVAGCPRARI